jgi:hypothetical protein
MRIAVYPRLRLKAAECSADGLILWLSESDFHSTSAVVIPMLSHGHSWLWVRIRANQYGAIAT